MTPDDPTVAELKHPGLIGKIVTHYRILQRLGSGGMGVVYKAVDLRLGRTVALKFLSPDLTLDPIAKERFILEAQTVSALDHPNICTIYEVGELDGGQFFLAMPYYDGKTLRELLKNGPLLFPAALDIARQTARGLARAHEAGIIHRDIKPDNILITNRSEVKILDFGIAKSLQSSGITLAGMSIGTPIYMSPEQVAGEFTDQRTDIWSLGVVMYEMVNGRRPFSGGDEPTFSSNANEANQRIEMARSHMLVDFEHIITKCLQAKVDERYRDASGLMTALDALVDGGSASSAKKWIPYLLAAAVLLTCFLLLWTSSRPEKETGQLAGAQVQRAQASDRTRIAVLPFENLGRTEDAYFADGITEEITSRLAAIPKLGVISRTSASQYHKNPEKQYSMQQIGRELNVAFVLEGTVRWERSSEGSSRVLVTPQLIRVADDTHIWSAKYEREMKEIFKMQSEIATNIIEQLNIKLLQPEWRTINSRPTSNMDAYHAYLRGLAHLEGLLPLDEESGRAAIEKFEEAVRLDPGFALAYARLSQAQSALYHAQFDLGEKILARAKQNAERALELQPSLPEAHIALGYYHYWGYRAYGPALRELSIAAKVRPNNNEVIEAVGYIKRRQGLFKEAVEEHLMDAFNLDPRNPFLARSIGVTLTHLRQYDEADKYYELSISLDPSRPLPYLDRAMNCLLQKGSLEDARAIFAKVPTDYQSSDSATLSLIRQDILENQMELALQRIASSQKEIFWLQEEVSTRDLLAASIYSRLGDYHKAKDLYKLAKTLLEQQVKEHPQDARIRGALAQAFAGLGERDEAINQARLAIDLQPQDAFVKPYRLEELALVYVELGEKEAALDQVEYLLSIPSLLSPQLLRIDPAWGSLRGNPRFEALIQGQRVPSGSLTGAQRRR